MKPLSATNKIIVIVAMSVFAIFLHELGHFAIYRAAGVPVRMTLQSVRPVGDVNVALDRWAKLAGPAVSWIAAGVFLRIALRKPGFIWATASFTNASLRLFPSLMDLSRAVRGAAPFSDEGDVVLAFATDPPGRAVLIVLTLVVSCVLTVLAARQLPFARRRVFKSVGVYLLSLAVGIAVILIDEVVRA